jgi:hypothetical protein
LRTAISIESSRLAVLFLKTFTHCNLLGCLEQGESTWTWQFLLCIFFGQWHFNPQVCEQCSFCSQIIWQNPNSRSFAVDAPKLESKGCCGQQRGNVGPTRDSEKRALARGMDTVEGLDTCCCKLSLPSIPAGTNDESTVMEDSELSDDSGCFSRISNVLIQCFASFPPLLRLPWKYPTFPKMKHPSRARDRSTIIRFCSFTNWVREFSSTTSEAMTMSASSP